MEKGFMRDERPYHRHLLWLIFITTFFRLIYINLINLCPDETYYWDLSRHLQLSYFDHPPLQMYLIALFTKIFGNTEFGVRLPSIVNSGAITFLMYLTGKELYGPKVGFYSSLLLTITPIYAAGSILATIDTPFALFWVLALYFGIRALKTERGSWWYLNGAAIGLGLLSKYIMILFIPAFAIFLLLSKEHQFWLKRKEPYIGGVISLVIFSPVIFWNSQNNWVSFRFQLTHGFAGKQTWSASSFLQYLGSQAGVISPLLFAMCIFAIILGVFLWLKKGDWRHLFLVTMSSSVLLFFAYSSLKAKVEGNWPMPAYFSIFILLVSFYCKSSYPYKRTWAIIIAGTSLLFTFAAFSQAVFPLIPIKHDITDQFHGWKGLGGEFESILNNLHKDSPAGNFFIMADSHQLISELSFYIPSQPQIYKLATNNRPDQYDLFEKPEKGLDAVVITGSSDDSKAYAETFFSEIKEINSLKLKRGDRVLKTYRVYFCKNFLGFKSNSPGVIPRSRVGGTVAPERLAGSNWVPIKASRRRKASPLEAGRLPRLRALDRSIAEARSKGATVPPFTEGLRPIHNFH